ncbi:MAG: hypothetical protein RL329_2627 [Bacteroidota bacterium]
MIFLTMKRLELTVQFLFQIFRRQILKRERKYSKKSKNLTTVDFITDLDRLNDLPIHYDMSSGKFKV